jgi:hypothetical protein
VYRRFFSGDGFRTPFGIREAGTTDPTMKAIDVPLVIRKSGGKLKRVSSNELTPRALEFIAAVAEVWPGIEKDAVVIKKPSLKGG